MSDKQLFIGFLSFCLLMFGLCILHDTVTKQTCQMAIQHNNAEAIQKVCK